MTDAASTIHHSLAVQKQSSNPSRQPLEVYHLSHDLRGPLNSILGFAELLLEGIEGPLNEMQQADISAIYQSAQNLLHLINTIVDLSKLEANRLTFDAKKVDLSGAIETALASFKPGESDYPKVVRSVSSDLPAVGADRERVTQLLKSLLRFAFKTTRKEPLTLTAYSEAQDVILCLEIIPAGSLPAELADLFDLMVTTDATGRTALGPGGLDLPLVRYLAEKQRGRVWAENNSGSLIIYTSLPVYQPAAEV